MAKVDLKKLTDVLERRLQDTSSTYRKEISDKLSETLMVDGGGGSYVIKNNVHHKTCDLSKQSDESI